MPRRALPIGVAWPFRILAFERVPIAPGHEAGVGFRAHDQNGASGTIRNQRVRELEAVNHGSALLAHVERRHADAAQFGAEQCPGPREKVVRRHSVEQDVIKVFRSATRCFERLSRGVDGQIAHALAFGAVMTLTDAGTLANPCVRSVHHTREVIVRIGPSR